MKKSALADAAGDGCVAVLTRLLLFKRHAFKTPDAAPKFTGLLNNSRMRNRRRAAGVATALSRSACRSALTLTPDRPSLDKMATQAVEEARMVLPGIHALFGFQLMAVFNNRFAALSPPEQGLHYVAVLLIAIAIALIMIPAAYHRQVERGLASIFFVRMASILIACAMVPLMVALALKSIWSVFSYWGRGLQAAQ